ncbi:hypothetical protein, partial [Exiguobacterium sp. s168]|uniref:hypothetical protein n=1 Tax=Exiguobacterium sp. s168 TaxID=2751194 RepID=UPI001BE91F4F
NRYSISISLNTKNPEWGLLSSVHHSGFSSVFGNEEFSVKARQAWVKQLIQSTVRLTSLSES